MNLQYLIHLANYSDGVLYVLGALLLVELSVIVDRFWFLRRTILRGLIFVHELGSHGRLDRDTLSRMADGASDLPEAALLRMAASHHGQVKGEGLASRHLLILVVWEAEAVVLLAGMRRRTFLYNEPIN